MAGKSYTIKTNSDGTKTVTKTSSDGTKSTSTSSSKNNQYDYVKGSYGTEGSVLSSALNKTYGSGGSTPTVQQETPKQQEEAYDYRDQLEEYNTMAQKLAQAQAQQRISELEKNYNSALSTIDKATTQTQQSAQSNRNSVAAQAQLAQRNLARYLAENGLQNSGTNAQAQINNTGALQNTIGSITTDEQNALNEYLSQKALAENNLASDKTAVQANADATALTNQLSYLAQMQALQQQYQNQANLYALQNNYSTQNMQTQRDWANEDYANNISNNFSTYVDPVTGQTYLLDNSAIAQLNQANYQYNNLSASQNANLDLSNYQFNNLSASERATLGNSQYQYNNLSAYQQAQLAKQVADSSYINTLPLESTGFDLGEEEAYKANTNYVGNTASNNSTKTASSAWNSILKRMTANSNTTKYTPTTYELLR